jgi:hypothetical protein
MTGRSTLWILIGCLAMAAGIAAIFAFGVPTNTVLLVALALACPLAHLLMMRSGSHDHDHHGNSRPSALEKS